MNLFSLRWPLIYFDLDVVITGDLSPLLEWEGFGAIKDWWMPGINSSVMVLAGDETRIWDSFIADPVAAMQRQPTDQHYIGEHFPPNLRTFPPHWFPSYKANRCQSGPPDDAMAVIFHGEPKPSQLGGWVRDLWTNTTGRPDYPAAGPAAQSTITTGTTLEGQTA